MVAPFRRVNSGLTNVDGRVGLDGGHPRDRRVEDIDNIVRKHRIFRNRRLPRVYDLIEALLEDLLRVSSIVVGSPFLFLLCRRLIGRIRPRRAINRDFFP